MKTLHEHIKGHIEKKNAAYQARANTHRKNLKFNLADMAVLAIFNVDNLSFFAEGSFEDPLYLRENPLWDVLGISLVPTPRPNLELFPFCGMLFDIVGYLTMQRIKAKSSSSK